MAHIIGGIGVSHVPAIGKAIAQGLQADPYWRPFFEPFAEARRWLAAERPDVAVVIYNDHGLNFFLDKMPTFAVGAAAEYRNADEGWGLPVSEPFRGDPALSWEIIEHLVEAGFDLTTCQEMLVDHAFTIPMKLLWPQGAPVAVVPIVVNTVQHPLPSARRCYELGRELGAALRGAGSSQRVVLIGTGGLSHQLEGPRAGFINKAFDQLCLDKLVSEPGALTGYTTRQLVDLAGSQGVEILNWLVMRGALPVRVSEVMRNYHIPISNTAAALQVLATEREAALA